MAKRQVTEAQWYLGVTGRDGSTPDDALLMQLLGSLGCQEVEPLGSGTAQARVPAEWAARVERDGQFSAAFACGPARWTVDIDLP